MSRVAMLSIGTMAVILAIGLTGCTTEGAIYTSPLPSSTVRLTPNPPHIYLAPFDTTTARYQLGSREGIYVVDFKEDFQQDFLHKLEHEMNRIAPTEPRWLDDLPDHGWLIGGEFIVVDQGSRALRAGIGAGEGKTTLETKVYVYDLSVSKTEYVLSFLTNGGSGSMPSGLSSAGEPVTTSIGLASGLKIDSTRTAKEIEAVLEHYK